MTSPAPQRNPVEQLAEEFLARHRRGEQPSIEAYTDQYPDLADEIRDLFPALIMMEELKPPSADATGSHHGGAAPEGKKLERLGDYRILREVGRGGMGIVYEAEQESLGRRVALKVLPAQALLDPQQQKRFQREARATARLHHTNIVPVYGVGEHEGLYYYVMQFIQGLGLDQVLVELQHLRQVSPPPTLPSPHPVGASRKDVSAVDMARSLLTGECREGPAGAAAGLHEAETLAPQPGAIDLALRETAPTPRSASVSSSSLILSGQGEGTGKPAVRKQTYWQRVAALGVQVADALGYAHKQGILHRDIKPSNLLLDMQGTVWVTDFGLAKMEDQQNLTHTGDIMGTLRYMPPEAFEGRGDARADLYALGLTLYEFLTFRPAFASPDRLKLISQISCDEPPRPRALDPHIPRDLETIVLKATDKDPNRRYSTAEAMAEDLQRFIADEPIVARRVSARERFGRWCRHNPSLATAIGLAAAALLAVTVLSVAFSITRSRSAAELARAFEHLTEQQGRTAEALGQSQQLATNLEAEQRRTKAALDRAQNLAESLDKKGRFLAEERQRTQEALHATQRLSARLLVERGQALIEQQDPRLGMLWLARGLELAPADAADLQTVARTGLASLRSELPFLRLTLSQQTTYHNRAFGAGGAIFSPDGKTLVTGIGDRTARLWDAATGRSLGQPMNHKDQLWAVAFRRDGKALVTASHDGTARLWDAATGKPLLARPLEHPRGVTTAVFSPDGKRVLTGCFDGTARLWDAATGALLHQSPQILESPVFHAAFSPDGQTILTGHTLFLRLWHGAGFAPTGDLMRHDNVILFAEFSPDGRTVASSCLDKKVRLWDVPTGKLRGPVLEHGSVAGPVAFRPDGKALVTATIGSLNFVMGNQPTVARSQPGTAQLWDLRTEQPLGQAMPHAAGIRSVAFSPDGRSLLTAGDDAVAQLWDADTGQPLGQALAHPAPVLDGRFSPDGRTVVTAAADNQVRLWELPSGRLVQAPLAHRDPVRVAVFSPDGQTLATGGGDYPQASRGAAQLWDGAGHALGLPLLHRQPVTAAAFSPDGKLLLTGSLDGTARLWKAATGQPAGDILRHQGPVTALAFHPDGKTFVTAGGDRLARLWTTATGRAFGPLLTHQGPVTVVAFSPDGKTLVTGSQDGKVQLWEAATGKPLGKPLAHEGGVQAVAFSPDGQTLLTGSQDKTARLWNVRTGQAVGPPLPHTAEVVWVGFRRDGKAVLTAAGKTVRLWDVATGKLSGQPMQHRDTITDAALSPDGQLLLTGSRDRTARLWHVPTSQPLGPALAHPGVVNAVAFRPDGRQLLTACEDRMARLWEARPVAGEPDRLARWVEVGTGLELTAEDAVRPLDGPGWQQRRQSLEQRGGAPVAGGPAASDVGWHQRLAAEAAAAGHWFAAGWHLDRVLAAQPADWFALALRGKVYFQLGQAEQAVDACGRALKLGPPDGVRDWCGRQSPEFEAEGSWQTARWYLDQFLQVYPKDGLAHALRTRAHLHLGQLREAAADYARAMALGPRDEVAATFHSQCDACETRGQWAPALWYLDHLVQDEPRAWGLHARRGQALGALGRFDQAARAYEQAVAGDPADAAVWAKAALLRLHLGDSAGHQKLCAEAYQRFARAEDLSGRMEVARVWALGPMSAPRAGRLLETLGPDLQGYAVRTRQAAASDEFAARVSRLFGFARTVLGLSFRAGIYGNVLAMHNQMQVLLPETVPEWLVLAMTYHRQGQADEARKWLDRAVEWLDHSTPEKPKDASLGAALSWETWLGLQLLRYEAEALIRGSPATADASVRLAFARAQARLQQWDQSLADYDKAVALEPADGRLRAERGRLHGQLGHWEQAAADFTRALEAEPGDAPLHAERGGCYLALGQPDKAVVDYTRAVEAQPGEVRWWIARGRCYQKLKQPDRAAADYARAVALMAKELDAARAAFAKSPTELTAREALADIYRDWAETQRRTGRPAEAAATLRELGQLWPGQADRLYETAKLTAACITPAAEGQADGRPIADQALATLGQAVLAGYRDAAALKSDAEFGPLRSRADFKALLGQLETNTVAAPTAEMRRLLGHTQSVMGVAVSSDGRRLLSASYDQSVRLWDVAAGTTLRRLGRFRDAVFSAAFSPDGRRALIAGGEPELRLYDLGTGKEVRRLAGHEHWVGTVRFLPDGHRALSGGHEFFARLWDVETGKEIRRFTGHAGSIRDLKVSPDGRRALTGGDDGTVRLWEVATGREVRRFEGHAPQTVRSVAFAPDGRSAVSGGDDGFVYRWDLDTGSHWLLEGHWNTVRGVAFSPDGRWILSGGHGATLILWDAGTGRELHRFAGASDVLDVAFFPDGRRAATANGDGSVSLWDLSEDAARGRDEARLGHAEQAEAAFTLAVAGRPEERSLRLQRGRFYARYGRWDKAVVDLTGALEGQPADQEVRLDRGRCYAQAGQAEKAAADFLQVLERLPDDPNQFARGNVVAGELAQWEQAFARAVELRPKQTRLWIARGRFLAQSSRWEEAAAAYARVIKSRPLLGNEDWFEHAALRLLVGDAEGYRQCCAKPAARAATVSDPFLAFVLARTCGLAPHALPDPARAVAWGERAVANNRNAWYVHALGLALYRADRAAQAVQRFEESDRLRWGNPTVLNWLGLALAHHRLGHTEEARRWLDKATARLDELRRATPHEPATLTAGDWLEAEVLRREAEKTLAASARRKDGEGKR